MKHYTMKSASLSIIPASLILSMQLTGCNNSGSDGFNQTASACENYAYLDGDLQGTLQSALSELICLKPHDDKSYNHMIIVSPEEGKIIDEETIAGLKSAFENNQLIVMEHVIEDEVIMLHERLGLPYVFELPEGDDYFELYAIENRNGNIHRFVSTHHRSDHPDSDNHRVNNFLEWAINGEERNEASAKAIKELASTTYPELKDIARGEIIVVDFSELYDTGPLTFKLFFDLYSAHSFKDGRDFFFARQWANINQGAEVIDGKAGYQYYSYAHVTEVHKMPWTYKFENSVPKTLSPMIPSVLQSIPQNKNEEQMVTQTSGWSESSTVGFSAGFEGKSASGGASYQYTKGVSHEESISFAKQDLTLVNRSQEGGDPSLASWSYQFSEPKFLFEPLVNYKALFAPPLAKGLFEPQHYWLWMSEPRSLLLKEKSLKFNTQLSGNRASWRWSFRGDKYDYRARIDDAFRFSAYVNIPLPPLTATNTNKIVLSKSGSTQTINLLSETPWKAECLDTSDTKNLQPATWCQILQNEGPAATSEELELYIDFDPNDTGKTRFAELRITSQTDILAVKISQTKY